MICVIQFLQNSGRALSDALFPKICYGCGRFIESAAALRRSDIDTKSPVDMSMVQALEQILAPFVCRKCMDEISPVTSPICTRCGEIITSPAVDDHLCADCIRREKHFSAARAAVTFDGVVLQLVHAFKYQGKAGLAKPLGRILWIALQQHFNPAKIHRIIPVPLHPLRLRKRGYNQALLLARRWPEWLAPIMAENNAPRIDDTILLRRKNTETQTGLGKQQRRENIGNAFAVAEGTRLRDEHVLIVDDVYTTGSTLEECARVLRGAGAARVDVLTLARAL